MRQDYIERYATYLRDRCRGHWDGMINEWRYSETPSFWLTGAANYLFYTNQIHWGMDLSFRNPSIFQQLSPLFERDLNPLRFCIVTHAHGDHYYPDTINRLARLPIQWIIPLFMKETIENQTRLTKEKIIYIDQDETIEILGITIRAFKGFHWEINRSVGIDCMGYLVETDGGKLLFPGDVRNYDSNKAPSFHGIDHLFAHVWLGRNNALNPYPEEYLLRFVEFMLSFSSDRILLTHLYEIDRKPDSLWTYGHAGMIMDIFAALSPETKIYAPKIWEGIPLTTGKGSEKRGQAPKYDEKGDRP